MNPHVAYCRDRLESRSGGNLVLIELLAAPRADDDVRRALNHLMGSDNPLLGRFAVGALGKYVDPTRGFDQLRHPGDAGDHWFVPLFEINLGPVGSLVGLPTRVVQIGGEATRQDVCAIMGAHQRAKHSDHVENFAYGALIEGVDGDARPDEARYDVGLQIGESQDEVGFEREDLGNVEFPAKSGSACHVFS